MTRKTAGFTLIELVFVILIGSILTMVALSTFQTAQAQFAARGAKTMYATLQQRARSRAIELGETVYFFVDSGGDSAYIVSGGAVSDVTHFRRQMNVDLRSSPSSFMLCMTPQGFADPDSPACTFAGTSTSPVKVEFWMNADSSSVTILPMGQLVGM
jgi:prepilin-type N-terminal cleavage/methylation domain-containing protein